MVLTTDACANRGSAYCCCRHQDKNQELPLDPAPSYAEAAEHTLHRNGFPLGVFIALALPPQKHYPPSVLAQEGTNNSPARLASIFHLFALPLPASKTEEKWNMMSLRQYI